MMLRRVPSLRAGFTLIELMISAALMSLILAAGYACLSAGLSTQRLLDPRLDAAQGARVVLARLSAELRAACVLSPDAEFVGISRAVEGVQADHLDFATHHFTPVNPGEGDYCQLSYFLQRDERSGDWSLWRRRNSRIGLEPFEGGQQEALLEGVRRLQFEYYDGFDWYDMWGDPRERERQATSRRERYNLEGLPEAVRITLWVRPGAPRAPARDGSLDEAGEEPPLVFQTVARLNLAARPADGGAGGGGGATEAASEGTPEAGAEVPGAVAPSGF